MLNPKHRGDDACTHHTHTHTPHNTHTKHTTHTHTHTHTSRYYFLHYSLFSERNLTCRVFLSGVHIGYNT